MKKYFITGTGTDVGKTLASAIITEYLKADYWKPIQAGNLENSDSMIVRNLISNSQSIIHNEAYLFKTSASPHIAAEKEDVNLEMEVIKVPPSTNQAGLIIEGAGGILVPLNKTMLMIDLIQKISAEVILVSKNYLGSINHTLLSIEALKQRGISIKGIVFNGEDKYEGEEAIMNFSGCKTLFHIPHFERINRDTIKSFANSLAISPL
jgi:dethiobiotin synthetase